jgi:hypothetical protein
MMRARWRWGLDDDLSSVVWIGFITFLLQDRDVLAVATLELWIAWRDLPLIVSPNSAQSSTAHHRFAFTDQATNITFCLTQISQSWIFVFFNSTDSVRIGMAKSAGFLETEQTIVEGIWTGLDRMVRILTKVKVWDFNSMEFW